MFTEAAEDILRVIDDAVSDAVIDQALGVAKKYTEVDVDSLRNGKKALRKEHVINQLLVACLACQQHTSATHEVLERLRKELKTTRTLLARTAKAGPSKSLDDIASHYPDRVWRTNPKLRESMVSTAKTIGKRVNEELARSGLKAVREETIRKRLRRPK